MFSLLKQRSLAFRADIWTVIMVTIYMFYRFGWEMADMENLLAVGCLILAILFNSVLLLSNFWSVKANEFFGYSSVSMDQVEKCTHVRVFVINHKQNLTKRFIVPIEKVAVELPGKVSVAHQIEV